MFKPSTRMLSGEIVCAAFALAVALVGGLNLTFDPGPLHRMLLNRSETHLWLFFVGTPALALIAIDILLWLRGEQWNLEQRYFVVCRRSELNFLLMLSWYYVLYVFLIQSPFILVPVTLQAPFGAAACGWAWLENRRVRRSIKSLLHSPEGGRNEPFGSAL